MIALRLVLASALLITSAGASRAAVPLLVAQNQTAAADASDRDHSGAGDRDTKSRERTPPPRPIVPPAGQQENPALRAECAWLGQRIVSLLFRDDPMTGNDFMPFFTRFGCPEAHLTQAFACVVNAGSLENDALADRIALCWTDPSQKPVAAKSGEGKLGEAKSGEGKNGEAKAADGKPAEAKPADAKPGDSKPADAKSEETKPADGKPAEGKGGDAKGAAAAPAKPAEGAPK